jgi:hypothetical protein
MLRCGVGNSVACRTLALGRAHAMLGSPAVAHLMRGALVPEAAREVAALATKLLSEATTVAVPLRDVTMALLVLAAVAIELEWAAVAVDALAHVDALVGHFTRSARAHFLVTVPVAMARVPRTHAHAAWCATLLADAMTLHLRVATEQVLRMAGGNESDSFVRGTDRRVEACFRDMLDVVDVRDVACVALFAAHVEWALDTLTICGHSDDSTRRTAAAGSLPMLLDWAAATTTPQLVRRHQLPLWARIQFCHAHVLLHDAGGTTALPIILRTLHTLLTADVGDTTRQERVGDSSSRRRVATATRARLRCRTGGYRHFAAHVLTRVNGPDRADRGCRNMGSISNARPRAVHRRWNAGPWHRHRRDCSRAGLAPQRG